MGRINNRSSRTLWVVETDSGPAVAHLLAPGRRSPPGVDADGFKAVDGTAVNGHRSWVKVTDWSTADVRDARNGTLDRGCWLCRDVPESQFGAVDYRVDSGWGRSL